MQIKVTVATALLAISAANAAPLDMEERGWASALTSVVGKTPNEKLNTGLAAGGVGMMGYSAFGAQKREPKGGKLFGDTPNSKLNTGLAAGGVGIMGTGLLESQFGQKRAVEPVASGGSTTASTAATEGKSNNIFGDSANSKLNTGLAAAGTGMMGYNLYNTLNQQNQRRDLLEADDADEYVVFYAREAPIAPIVGGIARLAAGGGETAVGGEAAGTGSSTLSRVGDAAGLASGLGGGSSSSGGSASGGANAATNGAVAQAKGQA